jgi:hypothetical protein
LRKNRIARPTVGNKCCLLPPYLGNNLDCDFETTQSIVDVGGLDVDGNASRERSLETAHPILLASLKTALQTRLS